MARIILVRHGKTDWNQELRIQGGSSNTPLNKEGRCQAEKLASRLSRRNIQAVYSSPLKRAFETARLIAKHYDIEVVIEKSLREIEAGDMEGLTSAELGVRFSDILTRDGVSYKVPKGESLIDLQQRSWKCIQRINRVHVTSEIVVVSHYFAILTIICSALMLPVSHITRLRLSTGCINILNLDEKEARLELFNDTGYLAKFP
ncbi:MAG: histidine phosphatase family protein [Dehalococcoidia bacterium]|nr:MAG: histidine phosphatase family protein [Dehalococcoidia bacterium]